MHDLLTLERAVARFVVNFGWKDIDPAGMKQVKDLLKDQLANQIGASELPWSRQVRKFRKPHPGAATLVGEAAQVEAAEAGYINATYGHGFEYDDFAGNAHPGCCVIPTALAVGEEVGATLEQVVVAMVAGYETYVRIGRLGSPDLLNCGWQPHAVLANFGAAAVAAKLHGLDEEQTQHALAIALSHAGGTTEYASTGGSIKRAHAGMAVRNGIEAVDLARAGVTGPLKFLTGNRGLYRTFVRKTVTDDARVDFQPGAHLQIRDVMYKPYCCCAAIHAYIEAMEPFRARAADIVAIDAKVQTMTDAVVGNRNAHIYQPANIEHLQYSLPAQMALAVLGKGNGYKTHRAVLDGTLDLSPESEVIRFARTIKLHLAPELDDRYFVADVTVRFRDGSSEHVYVDRVTGRPDKPFTAQQQQAKLEELTEGVIGKEQAAALFMLIDRLEPGVPVGQLTALLRRA